jgi:hypothetical protein
LDLSRNFFESVNAAVNDLQTAAAGELLVSLCEEDLDKPTMAPPKGREQEFATYARSFLWLALHQMMHHGNVTDARRAAGLLEHATRTLA